MPHSHPHLKPFIQALQAKLGHKNILTDPNECRVYDFDTSRRQGNAEVVAFATTTEQVQHAIQLCNQYKIPLTARGGGTGTPGGAVPIAGGLVLSLERMNKIIHLDPANRMMIVEPGVMNQQIQDRAAKEGFFWAPDPGSAINCTLGGNLAYNAAGPRAIKYGTCRENTLGLQAVIGTGEIIRTGSYTTKEAVGYDLTRLLIGSEGTLAIITQATLKLMPLPEAKQTLRAFYTDIGAAAQAVVAIMSQPVIPCALEFIDAKAVELIRQQGVLLPAKAGAMLIIEIDGLTDVLNIAAKKIIEVATNSGLLEIIAAQNDQEAQQLWGARKALSPALRTISSGKINEDVVVPVAQIPDLLQQLTELSKRYNITIVNFGHAGNGNIHVNLMLDFADPDQCQRAELCLIEVFDSVLKLGGTLSGEHGIGIEKRDFMTRAINPATLTIMRQIKTVFDPNDILNPGKVLPTL